MRPFAKICVILFFFASLSTASGSNQKPLEEMAFVYRSSGLHLYVGHPDAIFQSAEKTLADEKESSAFACLSLVELAFGVLSKESISQTLALKLADQLQMVSCGFKDAVIAELRYGPHAKTPDTARYDHQIEKAAIAAFATKTPLHILYAAYKNENGSSTFETLSNMHPPHDKASFRLFLRGFPDSTKPVFEDILDKHGDVMTLIVGRSACENLETALSFWRGTSGRLQDEELGSYFLQKATESDNHSDIQYFQYKYWNDMIRAASPISEIAPELSTFIISGHPLASYDLASNALKESDHFNALRYALIASLNGYPKAKAISDKATEFLDQNDIEIAHATAAIFANRYRQEGTCLPKQIMFGDYPISEGRT